MHSRQMEKTEDRYCVGQFGSPYSSPKPNIFLVSLLGVYLRGAPSCVLSLGFLSLTESVSIG